MENIFLIVLRESFAAGLLTLLILLLCKLLNQTCTLKFRYYIWLLVVLRLAVPFDFEVSLNFPNFLKAENYNQISYAADSKQLPKMDTIITTDNNLPVSEKHNNEAEQVSIGSSPSGISLITMVSWVWFFGCLLVLFVFFSARILLGLQLRRSPLCTDKRVLSILQDVKSAMGITRDIPVIYSEKLGTLAIFSALSPKFILSKEKIAVLSDEEIAYVFRHELIHYRRKDLIVFAILPILKAINWFNPLIWLAFYKMEQECEISCDAEVLKMLSNAEVKQYGMTLIKIASAQPKLYIPVGNLSAGKNLKQIKRRVIMISKFKNFKMKKIAVVLAAAPLLVATGFLFLKPVFAQTQPKVQKEEMVQHSTMTVVTTQPNMSKAKNDVYTSEIVEGLETFAHYDAARQQIIIPKTNAVKTGNDITQQDKYWENKIILTFDGRIVEPKTIMINSGLIKSVEFAEKNGKVTVTVLSNEIMAFSVTEGKENLYFTAKLPKEVYKHIVVVDPAHGGADSGATAIYADPSLAINKNLQEKTLTLDLALEMEKLATNHSPTSANDIKVYLTRHSDTKLKFEDATAFANGLGGVYVNLHYGQAQPTDKMASGTETYYFKQNTGAKQLGETLQATLVKDLLTKDRGVKTEDLYMIKNVKSPAICIEVANLNSSDLKKICTDGFAEKAARSILNGLRTYFGMDGSY